MHSHIADQQQFLVHPQRNEDPDDLENDEGRDRVKHDDKERGYSLVVCAENLIRIGGVRESAILAA